MPAHVWVFIIGVSAPAVVTGIIIKLSAEICYHVIVRAQSHSGSETIARLVCPTMALMTWCSCRVCTP